MTNEPRGAAAWRPDPLGIAAFRWWDGEAWTGLTAESPGPAPGAPAVGDPAGTASRALPEQEAPAGAAQPTRGPWPASLAPEEAPAPRRPATFEEAAAGVAAAAGDWLSDDIDWSRLVTRLKSAVEAGDEELLEVRAGDHPPLVIDVAEHAYWWDLDLSRFPRRISSLSIVPGDRRLHAASAPGVDLDPLLWKLAHASFDGRLAPWLQSEDRYKLRRWPNLTTLPHEPEHLRAISMIGQAALTVDEFAAVTDLGEADVNRLLTTFSLMGLLRVLPQQDSAPRVVAPPQKSSGLFGRLLSLFGR